MAKKVQDSSADQEKINQQLMTKACDLQNKFDINLSNNSSASDQPNTVSVNQPNQEPKRATPQINKSFHKKMQTFKEPTQTPSESFKVPAMAREKSVKNANLSRMAGLIKRHTQIERNKMSKE